MPTTRKKAACDQRQSEEAEAAYQSKVVELLISILSIYQRQLREIKADYCRQTQEPEAAWRCLVQEAAAEAREVAAAAVARQRRGEEAAATSQREGFWVLEAVKRYLESVA